jgi:hypothetical protein
MSYNDHSAMSCIKQVFSRWTTSKTVEWIRAEAGRSSRWKSSKHVVGRREIAETSARSV